MNDFSCSNPSDNDETNPKAQCQDGTDNDSDGETDFSDDAGCTSRQDNSESGEGTPTPSPVVVNVNVTTGSTNANASTGDVTVTTGNQTQTTNVRPPAIAAATTVAGQPGSPVNVPVTAKTGMAVPAFSILSLVGGSATAIFGKRWLV